jgi:hypothetical protein
MEAVIGENRVMCSILMACCGIFLVSAGPVRLCPENPRYLEYAGKPTLLVTSGEHYGAVLNRAFDYERYLAELERSGLNLTRTFSGTYREVPGSFKIASNTLAPKQGDYLAPWVNTAEPGAPEKLDLDRFEPAYFARLEEFLERAAKRGVVVEFVLFCPLYEESLWEVSPMNARNNLQRIGDCPGEEALTLKHADLVRVQLAFVREIVRRLNRFDNLYYEICNEPYFGGVTLDWQAKVAEAIVETERELPKKHLIAQNIANDKAKVDDPNPAVSIFNFHYAAPPVTVGMNAHLNKPIADDETGFRGTGDRPYRIEAWQFLMAGGAIVSNLDYSFTVEHPDGKADVTDPTPGGGGASLRRSLAGARRFLESFPFTKMRPYSDEVSRSGTAIERVEALVEEGNAYAIHVVAPRGPVELHVWLPPGIYHAQWVDTRTGEPMGLSNKVQGSSGKKPANDAAAAGAIFRSPEFTEDIALSIRRSRDD